MQDKENQRLTTKELLQYRETNKSSYITETGGGTQDFTNKVFENFFGLRLVSKFSQAKDLFGNDLLDNIYQYEGKKTLGNKARRDCMCKINGKKVVVEVEAFGGISKGMKQIEAYMVAEDTQYAIVTDGYEWRFFDKGFTETGYVTKDLKELLSGDGKAFLETYYNTHDYYIHRLKNLNTQPFDTQKFHEGLITTAESLLNDFRATGLFAGETAEQRKSEIQTAYSLIIQFLLLKIIQNKRNIQLISIKEILGFLESKQWAQLFQTVLGQIERLGEFYQSYHNQQESLIQKILDHYKDRFGVHDFNLDTVRPFLDVYQFIFSFDFKDVKQDLFGAVYENYLKELYADDDTKKGQVFTPPEIVEFMLDEIGYSVEYIKDTIEVYGLSKIKEELEPLGSFNMEGLSIIDPACGSGTFLYKASGRILGAIYQLHKENKLTDLEAGYLSESLIVNNVVGFDIEPFPLYLAEMNILQTLLFFNIDPKTGKVTNKINKPIKIFSTKDSIAEFNNLEASMAEDLQEIIMNEGFSNSLFSKRDNGEIFQLKADLQDIDKKTFKQKIIFNLYKEELEKPNYKSFKITKKTLAKATSPKELIETIKAYNEQAGALFEMNIKKRKQEFDAMEKKTDELLSKETAKRMKFDFVIANPPYVKQDAKYESDLFGFDIANEKYSRIETNGKSVNTNRSKLNIFGFFVYLGLFLAKNKGKISYIIPRSFINSISLHRVRSLFKEKTHIEKLIDFGDASLFHGRGLNSNVVVGTDSCIFVANKGIEGKDVQMEDYIGEKKNITLEQYFKERKKSKIPHNELFNNNQESCYFLIDYINELKEKTDKDLMYSIYPGIDHKNKFNTEKKGYPIFSCTDYFYKLKGDEKYYEVFLDFDKNTGEVSGKHREEFDNVRKQVREEGYKGNDALKHIRDRFFIKYNITTYTNPTQFLLLEKKYRLTWSSGSYAQKNHTFSFSEDNFICSYNAFTSIGISRIENLPEIYYLFGLLNSQSIENQLQENYGGKATLTNIKLLQIPIIDDPAKESLKHTLIANSEKIINLCKNGGGEKPEKWGDICKMELDMDNMEEKIVGLKSEYKNLDIGKDVNWNNIKTNNSLPSDILERIQENGGSSELEELEKERDEIVEKLYRK